MNTREKINLRRKWKRWIAELEGHVSNLLLGHDVFEELRRIVGANKKIQSPVLYHSWLNRNYLSSVSTSIRRLSDHDKRSISLYRLIEDIIEHHEVITREYFASDYPKWMREEKLADYDFDKFARKDQNILSRYKLKADLNKLKKYTVLVKNFTDKWIAHLDLNRRSVRIPTYEEIGDTLKSVDKLYCKYYLLLTHAGLSTANPSIQFDWRKPLRHPWINVCSADGE
jgi:hypothetical protein